MGNREEVVELQADAPVQINDGSPFDNDLLEFEDAVRRIALLLPRLSNPFTVGVYGDWGSGKTSFMKMLAAQLSQNEHGNIFWFNAWEYENETSLLLPLISKLAMEFRTTNELFDSIKKVAAAVVLTGAGIATKVATLNMANIDDVANNIKMYEDQVGRSYDKWISDIEELKSQFRELVREITRNSGPLYIFIDDLDRCLPENIIKLIENIKHFLSVEGCECVFIMGLDKAALSLAIKARYGSEIIKGDEYLEKIINLSFHVPVRDSTINERYIKEKLLSQINVESRDDFEEDAETFSVLLAKTGIKNPRRIRILISRYLLFVAYGDDRRLFKEIVVTLMIYREFFSDAYSIMKAKNRVDYHPSVMDGSRTGTFGRALTFGEIEENSCRGFAVIYTDEKYKSLRYYTGALRWLIDFCFEKDDEEAKSMLNDNYSNPPKGDDADQVIELIDSECSRRHKDYFDVVDFIFSFS